MTTPPPDNAAPPPTADPQPEGGSGVPIVTRDTACSGCSYNLVGLAVTANCPECGMPIEQSLRGRLLRFAKPEYRREVQTGLGLVLNGIRLTIVLMFVGFNAAFASGAPVIMTVVSFGAVALTLMIALGYWKYTTPDPGFALSEQATSARAVVRWAVLIGAGCGLVQAVLGLETHRQNLFAAGLTTRDLVGSLQALAWLASQAAWLVQFFAVMNYTAWMAERIPDAVKAQKARRYRWLLPVVYVVGAGILIGPLIALVMYWNLLRALRKDIQAMG